MAAWRTRVNSSNTVLEASRVTIGSGISIFAFAFYALILFTISEVIIPPASGLIYSSSTLATCLSFSPFSFSLSSSSISAGFSPSGTSAITGSASSVSSSFSAGVYSLGTTVISSSSSSKKLLGLSYAFSIARVLTSASTLTSWGERWVVYSTCFISVGFSA